MTNEERDKLEHEMALSRFGGVQPEGNGKPHSIGKRRPSAIAEISMGYHTGRSRAYSRVRYAIRRKRIQEGGGSND